VIGEQNTQEGYNRTMTAWSKDGVFAYGEYYGFLVGPWTQPEVHTVRLLGGLHGALPCGSFPWAGPVHEMHVHAPDLVYDESFFGSEWPTQVG
jgi:hypothetical protein